MSDRGRAYDSQERAVALVFQLGLAVTSLSSRTENPLVQERLARISAELGEVIADLRSFTFAKEGEASVTAIPTDSPANGQPAA